MNGKTRRIALLLAILTILLCGCGNVKHVQIVRNEPSELFSDRDIQQAIAAVKRYFRLVFSGCTLTRLEYAGDERTRQEGNGPAIVLYATFDVDASGGDGSFEPNTTYDHWGFILKKNIFGAWRVADFGYG